MRKVAYSGALMALAALAFGAEAQETSAPADPPASDVTVMCITDPPNQQQAQANQAQQQPEQQQGEKPSVAKDVGSAVGGTAGQIAGAAVAGPIGAAAGGVVVERVGRAIGSVVKGDKKKKERKEAAQAAAAPTAKCLAQTPVADPGR